MKKKKSLFLHCLKLPSDLTPQKNSLFFHAPASYKADMVHFKRNKFNNKYLYTINHSQIRAFIMSNPWLYVKNKKNKTKNMHCYIAATSMY